MFVEIMKSRRRYSNRDCYFSTNDEHRSRAAHGNSPLSQEHQNCIFPSADSVCILSYADSVCGKYSSFDLEQSFQSLHCHILIPVKDPMSTKAVQVFSEKLLKMQ